MLSESALSKITGLSLDAAKRAKQRQFAEPLHLLGNASVKKTFIDLLINALSNGLDQ